MENQKSTLAFEGVKVRVCGPQACYVTIGSWTVYVDNSTNEKIVDTWLTSDPVDQVTSLNELQDEIQALKAENARLKANLQKAEEMQKTSIYWSPEDVHWLMVDTHKNGTKYKGKRLTEEQNKEILIKACQHQTAYEGLTWDILESYIDKYLAGYYPFVEEL